MTAAPLVALALAVGLAAAVPRAASPQDAGPDARDLPRVLRITVPAPLAAGRPGELRIEYAAPRGNVVAVREVLEDLDGTRRSTTERAIDVVARAFGEEAGALVVPVWFERPGRKRVVVSLRTDEDQESDPEEIEVDVAP